MVPSKSTAISILCELVFENLDKVALERACGNDYDSGDFHDDSFVAGSLDLYECAFQAVELASVDAHLYAFAEVYFVRGKEEKAVAECLCDLHEAVHLIVCDDDHALPSVLRRDINVS